VLAFRRDDDGTISIAVASHAIDPPSSVTIEGLACAHLSVFETRFRRSAETASPFSFDDCASLFGRIDCALVDAAATSERWAEWASRSRIPLRFVGMQRDGGGEDRVRHIIRDSKSDPAMLRAFDKHAERLAGPALACLAEGALLAPKTEGTLVAPKIEEATLQDAPVRRSSVLTPRLGLRGGCGACEPVSASPIFPLRTACARSFSFSPWTRPPAQRASFVDRTTASDTNADAQQLPSSLLVDPSGNPSYDWAGEFGSAWESALAMPLVALPADHPCVAFSPAPETQQLPAMLTPKPECRIRDESSRCEMFEARLGGGDPKRERKTRRRRKTKRSSCARAPHSSGAKATACRKSDIGSVAREKMIEAALMFCHSGVASCTTKCETFGTAALPDRGAGGA